MRSHDKIFLADSLTIVMGLMGLVSKLLGSEAQSQPRGYYETQKQQWHGQIPREVERILPDREGCERVTKLTGRSMLGVRSS